MKIKKILLPFLLVTMVVFVYAVPATRKPIVVTQPDGTTLTIKLKGDEFFHYSTSNDGYLLTRDTDGYLNYAYVDDENNIVDTKVRASDIDNRSVEEQLLVKTLSTKLSYSSSFKNRSAESRKNKIQRSKSLSAPSKAYPLTGQPKSLVILVNFTDKSFVVSNPQQAFTDMLNEENYSTNGGTGSARDYFRDNSMGQFDPEFVVVGPYTLPNSMSYYGGNDSEGDDKLPAQMVADACSLADGNVDFSDFDVDGDGYIDNVFIYYAGYNEAESRVENTVWPHRWVVYSGNINSGSKTTFDGKRLYDYACSSELRGNRGSSMCGIGTFCHEFGHVLGLPDYYITDYGSSHMSLEDWNIMDSGAYLNDGRTPPAYSAYDRFYLGWLTPTELKTSASNVLLDTLTSSNQAYIITQNGNHNLNGSNPNPTQFFTLENRQQKGWDRFLPGHGLMITRINYNASDWDDNVVNNTESAMGVDIMEADGIASDETFDGDLFPYGSITSYNFKLRNGTDINKPITSIREIGGKIYFNFMYSLQAPLALAATEVTSSSFTANWTDVLDAQKYYIDVYTKIAGNETTVMDENFSGITTASSIELTTATQWTNIGLSGWTGTKVYPGNSNGSNSNIVQNALKFGSSSTRAGNVIFPVAINGNATITISAKDWETTSGSDGAVYTVYHDPNGGTNFQLVGTSGSLAAREFGEKSFTISNATAQSKIKIDITNGRAFINKIVVKSGTAEVKTYVSGYENKEIGNITSLNLSGLTTGVYYYVIRANNDSGTSVNSNEIEVDLNNPTGFDEVNESSFSVYKIAEKLQVNLREATTIEVYNTLGMLVIRKFGQEGLNEITLPSDNIYLVKIGNRTLKLK